MKHQTLFSFALILTFLHCTKTLSLPPAASPTPPVAPIQAPPPLAPPPPPPPPAVAQVPTLPGPIDVAKILQRAGHFTIFVRLLKETDSEYELSVELNHTHNGITIFVPTDSAFAGLKTGTLNDLNDGGKVKLVKFHIAPTYISNITQFETVSNPLKTQAGKGGRFSLNVTTTGNTVNISTGVTNTTISGTVYNDNYQLAIYQIDQVLQPMDLFAPNKLPPAPVPAPTPLVVAAPPLKPKNSSSSIPAVEAPDVPIDDVSGAVSCFWYVHKVVVLALSANIMAAMF